jgi:hypothetical protein
MITLVSGLPRSGTSLMMSMLKAGGMDVLYDEERKADEDNPRGYFEDQRIKDVARDKKWLEEADGKAVKAISFHLKNLPMDREYNCFFMNRYVDEIIDSQNKMLKRRDKDPLPDRMADIYRKHTVEIISWLEKQENIKTLVVGYSWVISNPTKAAEIISEFVGGGLDTAAMEAVVDPELYRNRREHE